MLKRDKYKWDLHPLYLPIYEKLCALLPERWQPYSGGRTFEEQDALFAKGRTTPGPKVTDAPGGRSPHNWGCATDWTLWDVHNKPIWLDKSDPAWQEYSDACRAAGARWGIKTSSGIDCPHNELPLTCSWADIYKIYEKQNMLEAKRAIEMHATWDD